MSVSESTQSYIISMSDRLLANTLRDSKRLVQRGVAVEQNQAIVQLCLKEKKQRKALTRPDGSIGYWTSDGRIAVGGRS